MSAMPTTPKRGRPKPFGVGAARVRIERGPKGDRWYWRAVYQRQTFWAGWATQDEAEAAVIQHVARHGYVKADKQATGPASDVRTLRELLQVWVADMEDNRPELAERTVQSYRSNSRRLAALDGSTLVERLPSSAKHLRRRLLQRFAATTANVTITTLLTAWAWGRREGLVPDEDLHLPLVKVRPAEKRTPTPAEVGRVLARLSGWKRLAAWTLYETGARPVDVAGALRLEEGGIVLRGKTGERWVPISTSLHEALTTYQAGHTGRRVFHVTAGTLRTEVYLAILAACEEASVPAFSAYGLRRLKSDELLKAGADLGAYASFMGHSPAVALKHYRRATRADLKHVAALAAGPSTQAASGEVIEGPWRQGSTQRSTQRGDEPHGD